MFDSKKEAGVYEQLKNELAVGMIKGFERQVKFVLVPAQYERIPGVDKKGNPIIKEKVCEHAVTYTADFVVTHADGTKTVVDAKGARGLDKQWVIKRKLMRWVHKIAVMEV